MEEVSENGRGRGLGKVELKKNTKQYNGNLQLDRVVSALQCESKITVKI